MLANVRYHLQAGDNGCLLTYIHLRKLDNWESATALPKIGMLITFCESLSGESTYERSGIDAKELYERKMVQEPLHEKST